jgi:hypothetical protein
MSIQFKRRTQENINAVANRGLLLEGEPLFITDIQVFAIATSASTYITISGGGGGSSIWGSILGTLSNQTDLQNELTRIENLSSLSRTFLFMGA